MFCYFAIGYYLHLYFFLVSFITTSADSVFSSASYFGDGFTFEQLTNFSSESSVSVQFQTRVSDGVILAAVGQTDFLAVILRRGKIEIHIKVGVEEGFCKTPSTIRYDNLLWHKIDLLRIGSKIDLRINGKDVISEDIFKTNAKSILKIDLGVFLGGYVASVVTTNQFDKSVPFFRGCIFSAKFNGIDVLHPLWSIAKEKVTYNVEAGCSKMLRIRSTEAMRIDSRYAYLKYHRWTDENEGTFECKMKTFINYGLLLFNGGWKRQVFVSLEIIGGKIRGSVNSGAGVVALQSTQSVNDGRWHRVRFSFSSSLLEIHVDRNKSKVFIEQDNFDSGNGQSRDDIKLRGFLYVGGVERSLHKSLLSSGLQLQSYRGCLKDIRINYRQKSYSDILASHDTVVGCKAIRSDSTSLAKPPSLPAFIIVPQLPSTTSASTISTIRNEISMNACYVAQLGNLTVMEGGTTIITSRTISVIEVGEFSEPPHELLFALQFSSLPHHGQVLVGRENASINRSYFRDIIYEGKLSYRHDGSETTTDSFSLSLVNVGRINSSIGENGIVYHLCGNNAKIVKGIDVTYTVNVTITLLNDPPALETPPNYLFEPIRYAKTPLSSEVLTAHDPDSLPSDILYHVHGLGTGMYIEHSESPGRPVSTFTQEDINSMKINFVHAGGLSNSRMLLQVSNPGQDVSIPLSSTVIRVSSRSLEISVVNNTGITLVEDEWSIVSTGHLFSQTNAGQSIVDVEYNIIKKPLYGDIQVLKVTGTWTVTSAFLQSQLEDDRIRYVNLNTTGNDGDVIQDRFSFLVSACEVAVGPHTFNFTILRVEVNINTVPIELKDGNDRVSLSTDFIHMSYSGLQAVSDNEVRFKIQKAFSSAVFTYKDTGFILSTGDIFAMADLKMERLQVQVPVLQLPVDLKKLQDDMILIALVKRHYMSSPTRLKLTYIPDVAAVKITCKTVEVDEGDDVLIDHRHLFAETLIHKRFSFRVVQSPLHGELHLLERASVRDSVEMNAKQHRITAFTFRDILNNKLYYRHDDSETDRDFFLFEATPMLTGELPETIEQVGNISYEGRLNISIELLNDNVPLRLIDKPFKVVRHGQRLLTRNDLWYHDPDVNQDDVAIKFVRRGVMNGDILNATNKKQIYEFSQEDILANKVLFRHKKEDFGRFVFWVKDDSGTVATGLFVVSASSPFLLITNSSELHVQKGTNVTITNDNIQADTNLVGLKTAIIYRVMRPPLHGELRLRNIRSPAEFTQADVDGGFLRYEHGNSSVMNDSFSYTATAKRHSVNEKVQIRVYLASQQQPPTIRRNRMLVVHQSSSVVVKRSDLRATHPDARPRDIIFTIRKLPSYGYFLFNRSGSADADMTARSLVRNATAFSQWDVNQGHVLFIQNSSLTFDPENPVDNFTFEVSNGILSLVKVLGQVEIVPSNIPLKVSNFSVNEGRSRVLVSEYLDISNRHFDERDIDIYVIQQPTNGLLESSRDSGRRLEEFSFRLARAEFLFYTHDGSDTLQDSFRLQARTSEGLASSVLTCYVTVIPDNDQAPKVENNTGLLVWINSTTRLSSIELAAVDADSPPSDLTYVILPPQNGFLALTSFPSQPIFNFTQKQLNQKKVLFCHKGQNTGGFTFQVNDGRNFDNKHIFVITARLLVISLSKNETLQVFPGALVPITPHNLLVTTNDEISRVLTYHVTDRPLHGEVLLSSVLNSSSQASVEPVFHSPYKVVDSFTQSDINSGAVFYNQKKDLRYWDTSDSLLLTVTSFPAKIMRLHVDINISYDAYSVVGRKSSVKMNRVATVQEGGSFNLTSALLDASNIFNKLSDLQQHRFLLRYRIVSSPLYGSLFLAGSSLSAGDSFLHTLIERGVVSYANDGSEHTRDFFEFEAYLQHKGEVNRIYPFTITDTFNITVEPVNDNPPVLITKNPHLEVVRGFIAVINSSHLLATDLDDAASQITYKILQAPKYGKLLANGRECNGFTQDDVDRRRLTFIQDLSSINSAPSDVITSDAFYFSLADGLHQPVYKLFVIKILPVTLQLNFGEIRLKQGEVAARLSTDVIRVATNGDLSRLLFNVSSQPTAGSLYIEDLQVTSFTYHHLIQSSITYVMSDLSRDRDHMIITVSYNLTDENCYINESAPLHATVLALVTSRSDLEYTANTTHVLTVDALDASELASHTNSVPVYQVVDDPKYSQIFVQSNITGNRIRRDLRLEVFSHDDVTSGRVFLAVGSVNLENISSVKDQFVFRLGVPDGSVQPARSVFTYQIVAPNNKNPLSTRVEGSTLLSIAISTADIVTSTTPAATSARLLRSTSASITTQTIIRHRESYGEEAEDSLLPWLVPLVVALALVVVFVAAIACYCVIRVCTKRSVYARGHKSSSSKVSLEVVSSDYHRHIIGTDTTVRVTSSKDDCLEVPQQCPTASVVVTPLRKSQSFDEQEDEFVDGYYGDGYLSNSMPPEGLLSSSGIQGLSIANERDVTVSSPYGLGEFPPAAMSQLGVYFNSLPRTSRHHRELSSSESSDSAGVVPQHPRRHGSSGSLQSTNQHLSTPALECNQYWF